MKANNLDQARELHVYCTSRQWTDKAASKDELSFYTPDEILGVFEDEKLVSMIRNYTFNQSVRGIIKKMGGVSHVATFPEYRLRGYVKDLTKAAFLDMKGKKQSVSMLHPFKESFYSSFGYVGTNDNLLVKISLDGFSHYLGDVSKIEGEWEEKRVRATEVQDEFEAFKLELDLLQHHGLVFLNDMSNEYWIEDHGGVIVVFIKRNNKIMAAAKYIKIGSGENGIIFVPEMYWKSIEGRVMLFRYFAKHKDQFSHIELRIPYGVNFFGWLCDTMRPFEVNINRNPWMVRIIDAVEAISGINVNLEEEIILELHDEYCQWNNGVYDLKAINNKLKMSECRSEIKPHVRMDIKGLTSLLYGVYSIEELEFKEWLILSDSKSGRILDEWFPKKLLYNPYYF
ncbi:MULTISPECIES: GNAT family N-acetyltransferase [unclassified Clostridium]|uniref:GNAT family N-acetyltransferase n=1 Tax=unclassified Clostridium TaxID=2614128 RepID=UPI0025C09F2B|nr:MULTISPECIES: GNAT family N-acetyltransferase [unclassified Clostridium]